ncbi:amino acid adenylation domain-containing protein [Nocardiopsis nanhaiensis]
MTSRTIADIWPLTPLQEGLLYHHSVDGKEGPDVYNVQLSIDLDGPLVRACLKEAFGSVLEAHPNLRAGFLQRNGGSPVQVIPEEVTAPWQEVDLRELSVQERESTLSELAAQERLRRFRLERPPLMRVLLAELAPSRHRLVLTNHHILMDGWSAPLLIAEWSDRYRACLSHGAVGTVPAPPSYRDHLVWLSRRDREKDLQAWKEELTGLESPTLLARTAPPGAVPALPGRVGEDLTIEETEALTSMAREHGLTLNSVVQTAWALVLSRITGRDDVAFGSIVSGRSPDIEGVERMIGLFINTVPARTILNPNATPVTAALETQHRRTRMLEHQHVGLAETHRACSMPRIFDNVVVFENYPRMAPDTDPSEDELTFHIREGLDGTHYPVTLIIVPGPRLHIRLDHRTDLVDRQRATALTGHLRRTLRAFAERPDSPLERVDVFGLSRALRVGEQGEDVPLPKGTVPELLEERASSHPDLPALYTDGAELDYGELHTRANRLAHHLLSLGCGPERIAALALPRGVDLVVALVAAVKAGSTYLPIDVDHPPDRIGATLTDARPHVVITSASTSASIVRELERAPHTDIVVLGAPATDAAVARRPDHTPDDLDRGTPLTPGSAVSVIYTSGSTGTPKGVVGTQEGLVNRLSWFGELCDFGDGRTEQITLCAKSSPAFIDGTVEILQTLAHGGRVALADARTARDPELLAEFIASTGASVLVSAPSLLEALLDATEDRRDLLAGCRLLAASGELLPPVLATRVAERFRNARLVNFCGCTEASCESLHGFCGHDDAPLGLPIHNTGALVLDAALFPVPPGEVGELYYTGPGVTRGYLRRPADTAERYLPSPYGPPGTRMYRSGDLVRRRVDGRLDFVARADAQLNVRGVRVEPGEVESALRSLPAVRQAVVSVHGDTPAGNRLIAHVTADPTETGTTDTARMRAGLAGLLPPHAIPSGLVVLDEFPRTPTGKIDRARLPAPVSSAQAPGTPDEALLCSVYAEVLGLDRVGVNDDFFDSGGHSLLVPRLAAQVRAELGEDVSFRDLLEAPTPALLSIRLRGDGGSSDGFEPLLPLRREGSEPPLFCIHPAGGFGWCYTGLLSRLDRRIPIYALQDEGLSGGHADRPLPETARSYVARIRRISPKGPYRLLGWSFGGQVAQAMAAELEQEGEQVELLALLDSYPPAVLPPYSSMAPDEAVRFLLTEYFGLPRVEDINSPEDAARLLRESGRADLPPERLTAIRDCLDRTSRAARSYHPSVCRAPTLHFRATQGWEETPPSPSSWDPFAETGLTSHDVPTDHAGMTSPTALDHITPVLGKALSPSAPRPLP